MTITDDPGVNAVGRMHSRPRDTEKAAAYAAEPKSGTQRLAVLDAIVDAFPDGRSDSESEGVTGHPQTAVGARRNELMTGGWVRDSGKRRPTSRGGMGIVWEATPKALTRYGVPHVALVCRGCSDARAFPLDATFAGTPIAEWFEANGSLCKDCR